MSFNKVILIGNLTADPELKQTNAGTSVCSFSIAVNRNFKNAEGKYDADFINCVAFRKSAEFIQKYFHKGDMIAVTGRIQTGSYTNKEGVKVYTTDIMVEDAEFCGGKSEAQPSASKTNDGFMSIPNGVDNELPFF